MGWIAQRIGMTKAIKINDLHEDDKRVTPFVPRRALWGGLVEFSARAGAGFAHG
jgi:hypothetical protein